jgi:hypothetical protein
MAVRKRDRDEPLAWKEFAVNENYPNPHPVYQQIVERCEAVDSSASVGLRRLVLGDSEIIP